MTNQFSPDILPDSRPRTAREVILGWIGPWRTNLVPIFCANCGHPGGMVPEENCTFSFYLCDERGNNCAAKWSDLAGTYLMPDEIFWAKVREAQLEKYGRELNSLELAETLKNDTESLARLAKDRRDFNPLFKL